ncbi:MAG: hypothetical protein WCK89_19655 [bacterium]
MAFISPIKVEIVEKVLKAHYESTVERLQGEKIVLSVQDTTTLDYSTHPATEDLGPIGHKREKHLIGLILHDTMAYGPEGVPLGLVDVQCWARQEVGKSKLRSQLPIEQKESYKWLTSFRKSAEMQKRCPGTTLVSDTLSLLWAARRGLSETELLEALGTGGQPLPRAVWSPLFLAMADALVSRGGLLTFAHDFLRTSARDACLPNESARQQSHLRLADFFERQPTSPRRTDELPWQLAEAKAWQQLYQLLTDLSFFQVAWDKDRLDVEANWATLESNSHFRMEEGYRPVLTRHENFQQHLWSIALLMFECGHPRTALALWRDLTGACAGRMDLGRAARALTNAASVLKRLGEFNEAMEMLHQAETLFVAIDDQCGLPLNLHAQGLILKAEGKLDAAMELFMRQEDIARHMGDKTALAFALGSEGVVRRLQGQTDVALLLHQQEERAYREIGDAHGVGCSLGGQALVFKVRGQFDETMRLLRLEEKICRELGSRDLLGVNLGNQANTMFEQGHLDEALALHEQEERICRDIGNLEGLQLSYGNQANVFAVRGNLDAAMILYGKQEAICRQLGIQHALAISLGNQAVTQKEQGKIHEAIRLVEEQERICREIHDRPLLLRSLQMHSLLLQEVGDQECARRLAEEAEILCRELGNRAELVSSIARQLLSLSDDTHPTKVVSMLGKLTDALEEKKDGDARQRLLMEKAKQLYHSGDTDHAMATCGEVGVLCRESGDTDTLQDCLGLQGLIQRAKGQSHTALSLFRQQEGVCRETNNLEGLHRSLGHQALVLRSQGDLDRAMALHKQEEEMCRGLGNEESLQACLGNQGVVLDLQGEHESALRCFRQQEQICRRLQNRNGLQASLGNQAQLLAKQGMLDDSLSLMQEQERICRGMGRPAALVVALLNQAVLLRNYMDEREKAEHLAEEAHRMAVQFELAGLARQIAGFLANAEPTQHN